MKKLLVTALFGAFAMAQETTPEAAPSNHSLFYTVDAVSQMDGKFYKGEHLVTYSYKYADGYKLTPRLSFFTNYTENDAGDWEESVEHQFLQLQFDTPKYWDIVGFKTGVRVRYTAPTAADAEGFGSISTRLQMEQEYSSHFNLTVIPKLTIGAERNGFKRASGKRNSLVTAALEVAPQWKFSENLTLTYDVEVSGAYKGDSGAGEDNLMVEGTLYHEVEFMYSISALGDLGLGAIVYNEFNFGNHAASLITDETSFAGLRLQKNFDL